MAIGPKYRHYWARVVTVSIAAIVTSGMIAAPAVASEVIPPPVGSPLDLDSAPGSVRYLMERYGVSQEEALRRLELQRISPQLSAWFTEKQSDSYAGMWIDQADGGNLIIASTDPVKVLSATRSLQDRAHIRTVKVKWSLKALEATAQRLSSRLNAGPDPDYTVDVDVVENKAVVWRLAGAKEAGAAALRTGRIGEEAERIDHLDAAVAGALADEPHGKVIARQLTVGTEKIGLQKGPINYVTCDPRSCDPPMRGGLRLDIQRNDGSWGGCTSAFTMYSWAYSASYVLTAGHCTTGPNKVGITYTYHRNTPVGYEVYDLENGPTCSTCSTYPFDYAIQPIRTGYVGYWSPVNRVNSYCWWSDSTWQGCQDGTYQITRAYTYSQIGVGWIVCATGSGDQSTGAGSGYLPGTRCGEIIRKEASNGLVANICARAGDSGGPLFSEIDDAAYGILWGGDVGSPSSGPCRSPGNERNKYSAISGILDHVKKQTNDAYRIGIKLWP